MERSVAPVTHARDTSTFGTVEQFTSLNGIRHRTTVDYAGDVLERTEFRTFTPLSALKLAYAAFTGNREQARQYFKDYQQTRAFDRAVEVAQDVHPRRAEPLFRRPPYS